ncbi:MAG: GGDEF domain-containing protein [Aureliella sp.]
MVELLCTLTGIIAGVAVVASLFHRQGERQKFAVSEESNESDRILGIADQLQVISQRVAADVSAHNEKVVHISDRLSTPNEVPAQDLSTISEIITANQAMQGQLADAQMRIARQSRLIEQVTHQARTDALTGLSNRRALNEFILNSIDNATDATHTGLLMIDIDHFKSFNDNFGHTIGDAVLASFARAISVCCGESCYAARYGGEEFAVVLSASSPEELALKAATVRYYVSQQTINCDDLQLKITASGGMCELHSGDTCQVVYERADEGLYQAKNAGRNCGFWRSKKGWLPFPARSGSPQTVAELRPATERMPTVSAATFQRKGNRQASTTSVAASGAAEHLEVKNSPASAQAIDFSLTPVADEDAPLKGRPPSKTEESTDILDLNTFLKRLDGSVEQLRKADLPATAFMIEALGLSRLDTAHASVCWSKTIEVVLQTLRGIDITCLYRPNTLCVLLPGSSTDAGLLRAGKTKKALLEASAKWNPAACFEKLAVSLASVGAAEDNASFLNRLEQALEEAVDSSHGEVVIHDGNTCHFQET